MSLFQAVVQGTFGSICDEKLVLPGAPSIPPLSFTVHFLSSCTRNLIASRSCIRTRRRRWRTRRKAWTMKSTHSSRGRRRLNCSSLRPSRQEDHKLWKGKRREKSKFAFLGCPAGSLFPSHLPPYSPIPETADSACCLWVEAVPAGPPATENTFFLGGGSQVCQTTLPLDGNSLVPVGGNWIKRELSGPDPLTRVLKGPAVQHKPGPPRKLPELMCGNCLPCPNQKACMQLGASFSSVPVQSSLTSISSIKLSWWLFWVPALSLEDFPIERHRDIEMLLSASRCTIAAAHNSSVQFGAACVALRCCCPVLELIRGMVRSPLIKSVPALDSPPSSNFNNTVRVPLLMDSAKGLWLLLVTP